MLQHLSIISISISAQYKRKECLVLRKVWQGEVITYEYKYRFKPDNHTSESDCTTDIVYYAVMVSHTEERLWNIVSFS